MSDQSKNRQQGNWDQEQRDMRQQDQEDGSESRRGRSTDHHGLGGQQEQSGLPDSGGNRQQGWDGNADETGRQFDQSGFSEGAQQSDGSRQMGWNQNADDTGRQYDPSGFAQGGRGGPRQGQAWSGETRGDRQQFQSEYDDEVRDDGSMTREEKLQAGWQNPEDPGQIADEGLIDEDEEDTQGGRI